MRKLRKLIWAAVVIVAMVGMLAACRQNITDIALKNVEGESYRLIFGNADCSQLRFEVWENGEHSETLQVTEEMLSKEDKEKFSRVGKHTVTVNYQNKVLPISFTVEEETVLNEFTATFYASPGAFSGGATEKRETTQNGVLSKFDTPVREGYSFAGWYRDQGFSGEQLVTPYPMTENLNFYAKWRDLRSYTVTFYNGKTSGVIGTVSDVEHGTAVSVPNPPMMEAYEFIGWKTEDGQDVDLEHITSNISVYATYDEKKFTVTYYGEDGEIVKQTTVQYGGSYTDLLPAPQKNGYTGRWVDENTDRAPEIYQNIRRNIVIRAKFTINSYHFKFVYYLDDPVNELKTPVVKDDDIITLEYGRALTQLPNPVVVTGYTGEWVIRDQGRWVPARERLLAPAEQDLTVYVRYVRAEYTVRFYRGSVMLSEIPNVKYLDEITAEQVPALDGFNEKYQTAEWYENERFDDTKKVIFPYTVQNTVNIYVKVSEKERLVDFALPERDTDGALLDEDFVKIYKDADPQARPILHSVLSAPNANITVPTVSHPKYSVDGWVYADGTEVNLYSGNRFRVDDFYEYSEGKAIYAVISVRSYNVTFHNWTITADDSGTLQYSFPVYSETVCKYGTRITATPEGEAGFLAPVYPGTTDSTFRFGGWFANTSFQGTALDFTGDGQMVVGETHYYPRWYDEARGTEGLRFAYYEDGGDGYYAVTGYRGTESNISVPRTWAEEGKPTAPVRRFNYNAFSNAALVGDQGIVSVKFFADSVTIIEDGAFSGLPNLERVEMELLPGVANPDYFTMENGILYRNESGGKTLLLCPAKNAEIGATLTLDGNVSAIGKNAFMNVSGLTAVEFAGSSVGEAAFTGCDQLLSVNFVNVKAIGRRAFMGCYRLSEIQLGTQLTEVYTDAFLDTAWYESERDKEQNAIVLGSVLLAYLGNGDVFTVPNEVTIIAAGAFGSDIGGNLDALHTVSFGAQSNIKAIGTKVFSDCYHLGRVEILCGTTEAQRVVIAPDAFYGIKAGAAFYVNTQMLSYYQTYTPVTDYFGADNILSVII